MRMITSITIERLTYVPKTPICAPLAVVAKGNLDPSITSLRKVRNSGLHSADSGDAKRLDLYTPRFAVHRRGFRLEAQQSTSSLHEPARFTVP
jgi:hypothetical protein